MADDDSTDRALDDRLRAAMKSVDATTPSGYFDALANQILSRVESSTMQAETDSSGDLKTTVKSAAPPPPSAVPAKDEDSGLHDIRSLADTAKKRLSKKVTAQPPTDDVLASSSGSWRNIALPEPAKMVSLPALAELPSAAEIKAKDKAAKAAAAAAPAPVVAKKPDAPIPSASVSVPVGATVTPISAMLPTAQPRKSNTRMIASIGAVFAAAAAVALYVGSHNGSSTSTDRAAVASSAEMAAAPPPAAAAPPAASAPKVSVEPLPVPEATPPPPAPDVTAAAVAAPVEPAPNGKAVTVQTNRHKPDAVGAGKAAPPPKPAEVKATTPAPEPETKAVNQATKPQPGDPSFDDLLKEAGVQDGVKKDTTPKLAKKSLSTSDITSGMGALASKAQACYKGTQGTASVKLSVAPSGKVTKVTIGGPFASTPEGACVAAVVQSATFPPWDGGPQTVNYSYLISE